jgi:hypothetical protein
MVTRLMLSILYALVAFFLVTALARAQALSTNASGTIASGGTFQNVFKGNCPGNTTDTNCNNPPTQRKGCLIVNNSSHTMFVWPNPATGATDAKAIPIGPLGAFNCQLPNADAIQDPIYIDGTTGDAYSAFSQ